MSLVGVLALRYRGSASVGNSVEALVVARGEAAEVPVARVELLSSGSLQPALQQLLSTLLLQGAAGAHLQLVMEASQREDHSLAVALLPVGQQQQPQRQCRFLRLRQLRQAGQPNRTRRFAEIAHRWLSDRAREHNGLQQLFCFNEARQKSVSLEYLSSAGNHDWKAASMSASVEALNVGNAADQVDIFVARPWLNDDFFFEPSVDIFVANPFAGGPQPRLERARRQAPSLYSRCLRLSARADLSGRLSGLPLHHAVYSNDAALVASQLSELAFPLARDDAGWNALHYAAWYGHVDCIKAFVRDGSFPPNLTTDFYCRSALHLAVLSGRYESVLELLRYPDVDHSAADAYGLSPLELCLRSQVNFPTPEMHAATVALLTEFRRPSLTSIPVHFMDGSMRLMLLPFKEATTVKQLHLRIMGAMGLLRESDNLFAIWVCSDSLKLQLKPHHRPLQHLHDWRSKTVASLTNANCSKEDPKLFLRRNALCRLEAERYGHSAAAEALLFHEAKHTFLSSLLPCDTEDMLLMSSILAHIASDGRKVKAYLQLDGSHQSVLPETVRRTKAASVTCAAVAKRYQQVRRELSSLSLSECHTRFLAVCRRLATFNSVFFTGNLQPHDGAASGETPVFIGVNDIGMHILGDSSKRFMYSFQYANLSWRQTAHSTLEVSAAKRSDTTKLRVVSKQISIISGLMSNLRSQR